MNLPPIKFPGALDLSVIGETRRAWGGLRVGGIATVATAIGADLAARLPRQNKKQREGLALLVATALDVRDVNLMELAAALPRAAARLDMRYQGISRLLGKALIDTDEVRGQPDHAHRPAGPARAGAVLGALLGGVNRHVGCRREPNPCWKKTAGTQRRNVARSLISLFTRGLRRLRFCLQRLIAPPPLWATWKSDG